MAKIPVEAGKEYEIEIGSLGSSGEGVGRYNGFYWYFCHVLSSKYW